MLTYGPRGEVLHSDGRPMWYGLNGEALTDQEANQLLADYRKRLAARTLLRQGRERIHVSTIFLVLDHGFMESVPMLWETMVFGGTLDGSQTRYASRAGAKHGHAVIVEHVRALIDYENRQRATVRRMHSSYRARRVTFQ